MLFPLRGFVVVIVVRLYRLLLLCVRYYSHTTQNPEFMQRQNDKCTKCDDHNGNAFAVGQNENLIFNKIKHCKWKHCCMNNFNCFTMHLILFSRIIHLRTSVRCRCCDNGKRQIYSTRKYAAVFNIFFIFIHWISFSQHNSIRSVALFWDVVKIVFHETGACNWWRACHVRNYSWRNSRAQKNCW